MIKKADYRKKRSFKEFIESVTAEDLRQTYKRVTLKDINGMMDLDIDTFCNWYWDEGKDSLNKYSYLKEVY